MTNTILRFSLQQRVLVAAASLCLLVYGGWEILQLEIDVFPNLNRPRVVVMTEAPGMAPEEVETLITFPLETALNGATGVEAVRSSSGVGLSVIYVEFDWDSDIYNDRQVVNERIELVADHLPEGIKPQLAPISSIMGQIVMIGMWSKNNQTDPLEIRTLADWVVRQRLLTIPGVSQVFSMGGGRKQFQVLVNPESLIRYDITLHEVKTALQQSNENATGGYLDEQGPNELLVRSLGRIGNIDDLRNLVVAIRKGRSIVLSQVATVQEGAQVKRGDASAHVRTASGETSGGPAVVLTINKQPNSDTRVVSGQIAEAVEELRAALPEDVHLEYGLYAQEKFIDRAISNVVVALRDGSILVVVILLLFMQSVRTTFITLTAIPLSIVVSAVVFAGFGLSINTMTLGGLAVAMGELVDDAIVGVENVFRRLRENQQRENPKSRLLVVYQASAEVRNPIVYGTMIVVLVYVPLFALSGVPGRLFTPLGTAYIVSILSSLVVSLSLTPVLSYWLFSTGTQRKPDSDAIVLRLLKAVAARVIGMSLLFPKTVLLVAALVVGLFGWRFWAIERDFLPPFNEGAVQLNVVLPPGTSLKTSDRIASTVEARLLEMDDVQSVVRRTGRAELDEHAEGVSNSELVLQLDPESPRPRDEQIQAIRDTVAEVPGVSYSVEQPIAHLISHMLSGVKAQVGIKIYGKELGVLRSTAKRMEEIVKGVPGVKDVFVEPQVEIPQLRIEINRDKLELYGITPFYVNEYVQTAMNGQVVSRVLIGERTFDLLIRMDEAFRESRETLNRLAIELPMGGTIPLSSVARIYESTGPNTINRERVRRRIILQCNVAGRGLVDVVEQIKRDLEPVQAALPPGYFVEYGGQFESQQTAARLIAFLSIFSLIGTLLVLYTMFQSINFALQVLVALPMAFIGSVAALLLTNQTFTIATMVGLISLAGIASRNGILLLNHYLHLVRFEGESWTKAMMVRAGQERLAPVLMTALTSGIGLIPLALSAGEPGKEILYPVATVIIGGLVTSTLLEFIVRPALFWTLGVETARRLTSRAEEEGYDASTNAAL